MSGNTLERGNDAGDTELSVSDTELSVIKLINKILESNIIRSDYTTSDIIKHTIKNISGIEKTVSYKGNLGFINLFMELYISHPLVFKLSKIFNTAMYVDDHALKELIKLKDIIEQDEKVYDDNKLVKIESNYIESIVNKFNITEEGNGDDGDGEDKHFTIMRISNTDVMSQEDLEKKIKFIKDIILDDNEEEYFDFNITYYDKIFSYIDDIDDIAQIANIYLIIKKYGKNIIKDVKSCINMIVKSRIIIREIYLLFKDIEYKISIIEYEREYAKQQQQGGFRKKNNLKPTVVQSKEILGKIRRIYKVAGSRKEHIKYKGELISVSDYKKLVSQAKALKSQNKPVAKPKAKPASKSAAKPAPKPATKSATKPKAKSATKTKPKAKPTAKSATKSKAKPTAKSATKPKAK